MYISDFGNPNFAIQKFTLNGTFLKSFGEFGFGDGKFTNPGGIGLDSQGNVYVTDFGENSNVQKFDKNGSFLLNWIPWH